MRKLALVAILVANTLAHADELRLDPVDKSRSRTVPLKLYLEESKVAQPVILFSHGLGGSRENNAYLGKHWAKAGYVAVFMQHAGSDAEVWKSKRAGQRFAALKAAASAASTRQRIADVPFVIDQLTTWNADPNHDLHKRLDLDHIGMSGHSFGAATTLAVAGRKFPFNRSMPDKRIDAFLAMSPNVGKGLNPERAFGHLTKPILCMTGTKDGSPLDPKMDPATRQKVYEALPQGDKFQLVLKDAKHSAFGDGRGLRTRGRNPAHHPAIQQISVHFWNAYLKGNQESKEWLQSQHPISKTDLTEADSWQWK